jgi:outer membrane receptor protein involved in Fe transport
MISREFFLKIFDERFVKVTGVIKGLVSPTPIEFKDDVMLQNKLKPHVLAILGMFCISSHAHAENKAEAMELGTVEVVGTTPLASVGLPLDQVPANIQAATGKSIDEQRSLNLSEFMDSNLGSVTVNDTVSNPYQPDVIFRGFTASPLLGTPQGLSVFVDGVRVNEPFGDIVNWDLIPSNAISNINLIPGSNPLFGLNTLGGALSVHTKSGAENPGTSATLSGGSWGRRAFEFETGGVIKDKNLDYFVAGNLFNEDGWRDYSKSEVKQIFSKVGWQDEKSNLDLTLSLADNRINGIQGLPLEQLYNRRQAYSVPDHINNQMEMIALNGSHFISDNKLISGNVYFRHVEANGFNSNVNNNYNTSVPITDSNYDSVTASNVITKTNTDGFGGALQMTLLNDLIGHKNQFTGGLSADFGRATFKSDTQKADIIGITTVSIPGNDPLSTVRLKAKNDYYGLYGTDTFSITDKLHMTMSGRYNVAIVDLKGDSLSASDTTLVPGDLSGHHVYQRFNPAIGLNFNPTKSLSFFGGYNEGMRAPSPVELSCADPAHPCALPNAFGGDPHLDAVVSKTWEGGVRGHLLENLNWNIGLFRTENNNDIQFMATNTSGNGYFQNVGKTLRQGVEMGMSGKADKLTFQANYSYVDATFETPFEAVSSSNSEAVVSANGPGLIQVSKGNQIPGIPHHTLKLRLGYEITPNWTVGSNVITTSSRYARGDENNQDSHGQIPGHIVVNLDSHYSINDNWKLFAKVQNLFDRNYATFGQLGVNEFGRGGAWNNDPAAWNNTQFQTPGAPRAAWVGVTYEFGRSKSASAKVDND